MNEEILVKNLRDVKDIFDNCGITFWLDTGTLLGAIRDGKIIEWDEDVDLGTWYDNIKQIASMFPEFEKRRFKVVLNAREGSIKLRRSDCRVDISLYHRGGNYAFHVWFAQEKTIANILHWYVSVLSEKKYPKGKWSFIQKGQACNNERRKLSHFKPFLCLLPSTLKQILADMIWLILDLDDWKRLVVVPRRYFEKLSSVNFYGMQFNAPADVEKYLEFRYGVNWRIPTKKWIFYKDDGAIDRN